METRLYRKQISRWWWLKNPRYTLFILREISAVFLGLFAVLYLVQLAFLLAGPGLYQRYLALMETPGWIALHVVILAFALFHTVSWISTLPIVQPLRIGGKQAPYSAALLAGLALWLGISVGIGFVLLRG